MRMEQMRTCGALLSQYDTKLLNRYQFEMSQGMERFFLLSYCLACCWPGFNAASNLRVVRQWAALEFNFPTPEAEQLARDNGNYVPGNSVPIDVDVHHRKGGLSSRIFVTVPRFDVGRPITLGTVDSQGKITAYPNYSWHENQGKNCEGFTSVFRVAIDECSRLWVMDTGKLGETQVCPPQLLAFNLQTDELVFRLAINATSYIATSLFITPVVDVRGQIPDDCTDTFVYVADVSGYGVLVVDVAGKRSWRVTHRYVFPYPSWGRFTIEGESFDLMDGVLGMALSPYRPDADRFLYFHALASVTENIVRTRVLRNDSHIANPNLASNQVYEFPEKRPNQAASEAIDRDGIMYFGIMEPPSVWCWNTGTEFSQRNFHQIAVDRETLQFASGVKVVNNLKGEQELWILTSSFQKVMTGSLSSDKVNFRIHAEKISTLMMNSPCKRGPSKGPRPGYLTNFIAQTGLPHVHSRYGAVAYL